MEEIREIHKNEWVRPPCWIYEATRVLWENYGRLFFSWERGKENFGVRGENNFFVYVLSRQIKLCKNQIIKAERKRLKPYNMLKINM